MKRFKKLFALIMALSFLVLSACSGSPETSVPTDPDRTVPETTVPTIPEITVRTSPISSEYFWLTARGDNAFLGRSDGIGNFNGALQELWSADITEGSLPAVYIADLDGDKKNEVIYSYCGCLYAVKQEGGLFWKSNKMGESYIFGVKNVGPDAKAALVTLFGKNIVILDLLT